MQVGVVDLRQQGSQALAGGQRHHAIACLVGGGRGCPQQFGADLVPESPAAGFLVKAELSAAGIRRILAGEHR